MRITIDVPNPVVALPEIADMLRELFAYQPARLRITHSNRRRISRRGRDRSQKAHDRVGMMRPMHSIAIRCALVATLCGATSCANKHDAECKRFIDLTYARMWGAPPSAKVRGDFMAKCTSTTDARARETAGFRCIAQVRNDDAAAVSRCVAAMVTESSHLQAHPPK
ncbi:MAG: hypothetical protein SFX73_04610 [Kofleriaceae bacterium]|nr:hypothetical protein [Kofleriaceae bacterium]